MVVFKALHQKNHHFSSWPIHLVDEKVSHRGQSFINRQLSFRELHTIPGLPLTWSSRQ